MCGIIGLFPGTETQAITALKEIKHRGLDAQKIKKIQEKGFLGHALHSVVNFVEQPLQANGWLSANCEIYNWKELAKKNKINAKNDAELLLKLIEKNKEHKILDTLKELDGVFAFAYISTTKIFLARDLLGVKPLWYSLENGLSFASEKKALKKIGLQKINDLNPRSVLVFDFKTGKTEFLHREFFTQKQKLDISINKAVDLLEKKLGNAVKKRIAGKKTGLLFSGGVDSTLIALLLKKLGADFICYTAFIDLGKGKSIDAIGAEQVAKEMNLKIKTIKIDLNNVENYLKKILPLIESSNPVKAGVGLTLFLASEQAKKDGCKVIFSGLGSDELFAGYSRMNFPKETVADSLSYLRHSYERDLYRDDTVSMANQVELRLPFFDYEVIQFALDLNSENKLFENENKRVVRKLAEKLGLPEKFSNKKKKAAQYGSNADKAIAKLAKKQKLKNKPELLEKFYKENNLKLGILFSSGKDSCYAMQVMKNQNYSIKCLIALKSKNPDSFMFHTPNIDLINLQAKSLNLPVVWQETNGEKEIELDDLKKALTKAKQEFNIEGIVTGAIHSNYQRQRIEEISDALGLKVFSPLWHKNQKDYMVELLNANFKIIISSVAAQGLDEKWLGKEIDKKALNELEKLERKIGLNIAGEGGEYESLVINCPMFKKEIKILKAEKQFKGLNGKLIIKNAELKEKN